MKMQPCFMMCLSRRSRWSEVWMHPVLQVCRRCETEHHGLHRAHGAGEPLRHRGLLHRRLGVSFFIAICSDSIYRWTTGGKSQKKIGRSLPLPIHLNYQRLWLKNAEESLLGICIWYLDVCFKHLWTQWILSRILMLNICGLLRFFFLLILLFCINVRMHSMFSGVEGPALLSILAKCGTRLNARACATTVTLPSKVSTQFSAQLLMPVI
jgi:hypothetical protein